MSVGEALASAAASQVADQQLRALEILEQQISEYLPCLDVDCVASL